MWGTSILFNDGWAVDSVSQSSTAAPGSSAPFLGDTPQ
jgi:hypothetical protein